IFRFLSYREIGSSAILSRAYAGIRHRKLIACIPGSTKAVKLALEKLILPEVGHILLHARKG
ncbi:MAG: molybdenum cofactor biosynthesis protein, partial [archaeon GB-1867-035]|nr:molybdenum cofactor biosynthesis protein [Candidatus Culexmicrobium profundum]